ncbi:hypothetical protein CVT25_005745 [Psilocybe cyanescens]|uniref:Mediator of RNA polymerase II transcription subunit 7 n=1 Tax=Psilocybe cyanescens TaxID=93625 RepID=A0A409VLJ7_PSICY|nr:hypothetical protein CVT25_005745 [Psilocybe cyanescens]
MDEDNAELRNPFPSPPSHYAKYTTHNLNLLSLLKERASDDPNANQYEILKDQVDVPDWPLVQLEKPRVDWILEEPDAYYDVFGDRWFVRKTATLSRMASHTKVKEKIPSLAELGGNQLYPADPTIDRRPALRSILRSLLVTYSSLTGSLLSPPPLSPEVPPDWQRHVEWINVLSQNLMAAANDLRPVQARGNLEMMMKRQLDLRREETKKLHEKCDGLSAKLSELRTSVQKMLTEGHINKKSAQETEVSSQPSSSQITEIDVLDWAEQVR